jgi:hypothetical protein
MLPRIMREVVALSAPVPGAALYEKILRVGVPESKQDNWCWAAVARGVALAYGSGGEKQCEIASRVLSPKGCCPTRKNNPCDVVSFLQPALDLHHRDFDGSLSVEAVRQELREGRPVCARMARVTNDEEGHFVLIAAWGRNPSGAEFFLVWDPDFGNATEQWVEVFRTRYRDEWRWDYSYLTQPHPQRGLREVPAI